MGFPFHCENNNTKSLTDTLNIQLKNMFINNVDTL